jgi:hypothetical protein
MKKILTGLLFSVTISLLLASCTDTTTTYKEKLAAENSAIDAFIKRNNIEVVTTAPADNDWGTKKFLKTSNGLYIHMVDNGEAGATVQSGELVTFRMRKISLDTNETVVTNTFNTLVYPNPDEFNYDVSGQICDAFQEAVKIMKRHNSQAELIVPSKIGFETDYTNVVPYFYELKIKLTN